LNVRTVITALKLAAMNDQQMHALAYLLPRKLVYFCGIRMWTETTTGAYSKTIAPQLTVDEALRRWERDDA